MPIQTYDTTDAIPEEHRDTALALADGKFAVVTDEDVSGLKANAAKLLEEKKQADKDRRELAKRLSDLEQQQKAAASGITSEQLAKLKADVELEYAPVREKAATLETQLRALKLDNAVQGADGESGRPWRPTRCALEADGRGVRFDGRRPALCEGRAHAVHRPVYRREA